MRVLFYAMGTRSPVEEFIRSQPAIVQATIARGLDLIERYDLGAPGVSSRQVRGKLWELRFRTGDAIRIFYVVHRQGEAEMILLHGYKNRTQKTPPREIRTAERRMGEILR